MLRFEPIELSHFEKIYELLSYQTADDSAYGITSILAWQPLFNPKVVITDDFVLFSLEESGETYFNSPLAKDKESYCKAIDALIEAGVDRIQLALKWQAEILKEKGFVNIKEERNMSEYLYNTSDLIDLKGKKYHSKRNFINGFRYPHVYREYREEDFDGVMALLDKWYAEYLGDEVNPEASWSYINGNIKLTDYDLEKDAVILTLRHLKDYRVFADVLEIDGDIAGFSAGEILPNNIGVIYFEKGDTDYKGIYPFIDNLFVKKRMAHAAFINKQEDMGLLGLRKSKLSYSPVKLIDRYTAKKC